MCVFMLIDFILLQYKQTFLYVINLYIHFYNFFFIEILMMYNIMLVSGVLHSDLPFAYEMIATIRPVTI